MFDIFQLELKMVLYDTGVSASIALFLFSKNATLHP